jgi:hypothetical protein
MNTIVKLAAPVAIAFAALGAQASEVGSWEQAAPQESSRPVAVQTPASGQPMQLAAGRLTSGEVAPGDIITSPVRSGSRAALEMPTIAAPAAGVFAVGA